jgi:hypothetical protein
MVLQVKVYIYVFCFYYNESKNLYIRKVIMLLLISPKKLCSRLTFEEVRGRKKLCPVVKWLRFYWINKYVVGRASIYMYI